MSNWLILDKNNNIFADVDGEEEARDLIIVYTTDPWTEDAAPFKLLSYEDWFREFGSEQSNV